MSGPSRRRGSRGRGGGGGGGGAADRRTRRGQPPPGGGGQRRTGGGPGRRAGTASAGVGGEQVEGRQAVRELLLAGRRRVREVLLADDLDQAAVVTDIVELASEAGVPVKRLSRRALDAEARTDAPQGVVARADPLPAVDLDDLVKGQPARPGAASAAPFLVALDGVTDPRNLGAVLRSAEGAGATGVVLPAHRAVHVTPAVTKAAAGAVEHLPIATVGGLPNALSALSDAGLWVVGLDEGGDRPLWGLRLGTEAVVLVLGSEGRGLGRLVRQRCDEVVSIPMAGALPSLNVSVAGALACFEIARARAHD